ncbi:MAG: response regulator [Oscillatoriales cyanobacterium]|nr:MAG: response regulator [Oscillatoriales cyanobacterium]
MQIEDVELRDVFQSASIDELGGMRDGLKHLAESGELEGSPIDTMLRKAHSMKGSAGMLGLKDIATLARQWEELTKQVVAGQLALSEAVITTLHEGLEAIERLVDEAITGNPAGVQTFYILAQLMNPERVTTSAIAPEDSDELEPETVESGAVEPVATEAIPTGVEAIGPDEKSSKDKAEMSTPEATPSLEADHNDRSPTAAPEVQVRQIPSRPKIVLQQATFIDDEELRDTFRMASADHLESLDSGLLYLEQHPNDHNRLDAVLREIHSIKGDSGMLGVEALVPLAHAWEQQLIPVKTGQVPLTSELCDRLALGLDRIRALVRQATEGIPTDFEIATAIADLEQPSTATQGQPVTAQGSTSSTPATPPTPNPRTSNPDQAPPSGSTPPTTPQTSPKPHINQGEVAPVQTDLVEEMTHQALGRSNHPEGNYRIDTIRVATSHLDALMTQAGELTVSKSRIAHRMMEIEAIAAQCERLNRGAFANRFAWDALRNLKLSKEEESVFQKIQAYHQTLEQQLEELTTEVESLQLAISEDTARLEAVTSNLEEGIQTLRLLPLSTIFNLYPRMVRDLARSQEKQINFMIEGEDTLADKRVLEEMKDPLMHIIRNAIDHGIESPEERQRLGKSPEATLILRGYQSANSIAIEVSDDGRGLDLKKIEQTAIKHNICRAEELAAMTPAQIQSLIFMPGFSTRSFVTEVSGRGVGLDVVRANVEHLKGNITINSERGRGCTMHIELGSMLSTTHVLLVEINHTPYAIPVEYVRSTTTIEPSDIFLMENRETILVDNLPISLAHLSDLLQLPNAVTLDDRKYLSCIILSVDGESLAIVVDRLIDQQDTLLKPQSQLLQRVRNVSGATILGTGEICMVLHPPDLVESVRGTVKAAAFAPAAPSDVKQRILLAEDSIATRTQEKRILEAAGYEVVPAVDGLDAFNKLRGEQFDAIVSDVQMPNLDGLQLTARVRQNNRYAELPIILVTSLATDEDRRRGADAGANAYITKSSFNQDVLIETLRRLI